MAKINKQQIHNSILVPDTGNPYDMYIDTALPISDTRLLKHLKAFAKREGYPLNPRAARDCIRQARLTSGLFQTQSQVYQNTVTGWENVGRFEHGRFIDYRR